MRKQQLIWHDMEGKIDWSHETEYAWFSEAHVARFNGRNYYPVIGYFVSSKNKDDIVFRCSNGNEYQLNELKEWAEL